MTATMAETMKISDATLERQVLMLSVIVPTFNEVRNVREIVDRLDAVLGQEKDWEVIFVDDASTDGTAAVVRELGRADRRVRLIYRHNRRGLSSAVVEGALAAAAPVIVVMDGDLQHDEAIVPKLYEAVVDGGADIAVASRFLDPGGADGLSSEGRRSLSQTGIRIANALSGLSMTDPLTGFFAVRRSLIEQVLPHLSELGFKILLDLLTSVRPRPRVTEVPFRFRPRLHGDSKLDGRVLYDFMIFFIEKFVRRFIPLPAQFLSFSLINAFGLIIHVFVFSLLYNIFGLAFSICQLIATFFAMAFNFFFNNAVTYRNRKLKGRRLYIGFLIFSSLCSIGIIGNIGVATAVYRDVTSESPLLSSIIGAMVTVVWNYAATRVLVWGRNEYTWMPFRRRRPVRAQFD